MLQRICTAASCAAVLCLAAPACAQQQAGPLLAIGEAASDFAIPGATRYGELRDPVPLSNFRGETVVLSFFFRGRTGG